MRELKLRFIIHSDFSRLTKLGRTIQDAERFITDKEAENDGIYHVSLTAKELSDILELQQTASKNGALYAETFKCFFMTVTKRWLLEPALNNSFLFKKYAVNIKFEHNNKEIYYNSASAEFILDSLNRGSSVKSHQNISYDKLSDLVDRHRK